MPYIHTYLGNLLLSDVTRDSDQYMYSMYMNLSLPEMATYDSLGGLRTILVVHCSEDRILGTVYIKASRGVHPDGPQAINLIIGVPSKTPKTRGFLRHFRDGHHLVPILHRG